MEFIVVVYGMLFFAVALPFIMTWEAIIKKGDERRKMILEKTCTETFVVTLILITVNISAEFIDLDSLKEYTEGAWLLAVIGILFNVRYFLLRKKYGD